MLKVAKAHLTEPKVEFTMESILNDSVSLEGWLSSRRQKRDEQQNLIELNALRKKTTIDTTRALESTLKEAVAEVQKALSEIDSKIDDKAISKMLAQSLKSYSWMMSVKRGQPDDLLSLMRYAAYATASVDPVLSLLEFPLDDTADMTNNKVLFAGEHILVYASEYKGTYSISIESRFAYHLVGGSDKKRLAAVDDFRDKLFAHLKKTYKSVNEDDAYVDDMRSFRYYFDEVERIALPDAAIEKFIDPLFKYDEQETIYWLVEHNNEYVVVVNATTSWVIEVM